MVICVNKFIPVKGFAAMYFCGILFVRKGAKTTLRMLNHEKIHHEQAKELLFVLFYLWYIIEWVVRLFLPDNAYRNICFEREAYSNESNYQYVNGREKYTFLKYLKHAERRN